MACIARVLLLLKDEETSFKKSDRLGEKPCSPGAQGESLTCTARQGNFGRILWALVF